MPKIVDKTFPLQSHLAHFIFPKEMEHKFLVVLSLFFELEPHAKFHDPRTIPSGRKVRVGERKRERNREISAHADGGPRPRVCSRDTPAKPPIDVSENFLAHVSAV